MQRRRRSPRSGWFDGLGGAFAGAAFGLVLFLASIGVLWWNEGRVNLADVARRSVEAPIDRVSPALEARLVSVTSAVQVREGATDTELLRPAGHVSLERSVEMYAWVEHERPNGRPQYWYTRDWTAHPPDSAHFADPHGHENPAMRYRARAFYAPNASLGPYAFAPAESGTPPGVRVALTEESIGPNAPSDATLDAGYLYVGEGKQAHPAIGDLRIAYLAYDPGAEATLFGQQQGSSVRAYQAGSTRFHRLLRGSREAAIATLASEHRGATWALRAIGFALLWLALNLWFGPVNAALDIVPPLGRAGRSMVAAVTAPIALAMSVTVAVASAIVHGALGHALVGAALVAAGVWWSRGREA